MSFSTLILFLISIFLDKSILSELKPELNSLMFGIISAIFLYLIFLFGNLFINYLTLKFNIISDKGSLIENIYANKSRFSPVLISALIFFPIAFGEEVFWRGFVQKNLSLHYSKWEALLITVFLYTFIHIFSMNPILMIAAFVCGIFWGIIYLYTDKLNIVLISHIVWDLLIFVIYPIR